MTSFAVVTPSRGLVHSRTIEAVMAAIDVATAAGHEFRGWRLSHDLPIPACHEKVAELGLATGAEALVFIEEDMIVPVTGLLAMLAEPSPIVAIDYPMGEEPAGNCIYHWGPDGAPMWCGLGCTLIRRVVFETLARPWFDSSRQYRVTRYGNHYSDRTDLTEVAEPYVYGGQDISFCLRATKAGFPIAELTDMTAGHAHLRTWGEQQTNVGWHRVDVVEQIERRY